MTDDALSKAMQRAKDILLMLTRYDETKQEHYLATAKKDTKSLNSLLPNT